MGKFKDKSLELGERQVEIAEQQAQFAQENAQQAFRMMEHELALQAQQFGFQNQISSQALEIQREQFGLQRQAFGLETKRFAREEELFRLQMLLFPTQLEQLGLRTIRDTDGRIAGFERDPDSLAERQRQLSIALTDRALQAVKGELPVPKALERAFQRRDEQLQEVFRRNLGEGFATSSPFIEAQAEEGLIKETAFDSARRDDLVTATQLANVNISGNLNRTLQTQQGQLQAITPLSGVNSIQQSNLLGAPLPGVPGVTSGGDFLRASVAGMQGAGQGIAAVQDMLVRHRQLNKMGGGGGFGSIAGSLVGAAAGSFFGGFGSQFGSVIGERVGSRFDK